MVTLFVKVETDAGIVGWGEAFGFAVSPLTAVAIRDLLAPLCVGADPSDGPALVASLQKRLHNMGRYGPITFGLSGLDIALWDIAGKLAGKPVHALLGGAVRRRIPIYASLMRYGGEAELVARNAARAVARGHRHVKLHEKDEASVAAARRAVGPDVALMLDVNCGFTLDGALELARRLVPYNLQWLEEPVWPPEDADALARVTREGGVPTAAGENAVTPYEMREWMREHSVDYVQPSVTKLGGISELARLVGYAGSVGAKVAPHSPYVGPGLVATLHVLATVPDVVAERYFCDLEASPIAAHVTATDGHLAVDDAPGLGIEVDEEVIARYRVA